MNECLVGDIILISFPLVTKASWDSCIILKSLVYEVKYVRWLLEYLELGSGKRLG